MSHLCPDAPFGLIVTNFGKVGGIDIESVDECGLKSDPSLLKRALVYNNLLDLPCRQKLIVAVFEVGIQWFFQP